MYDFANAGRTYAFNIIVNTKGIGNNIEHLRVKYLHIETKISIEGFRNFEDHLNVLNVYGLQ